MPSEAPPSRAEVTTSFTCRDSVEVNTFTSSGITAPANVPQEIIDASFHYLGEYDREWARREYPKPVITTQEAFDLSLQTLQQANNRLMYGVMSAVSHFAGQLSYPKRFDTTHLLTCLPNYERDLPHVRDYYGKVVQQCIRG